MRIRCFVAIVVALVVHGMVVLMTEEGFGLSLWLCVAVDLFPNPGISQGPEQYSIGGSGMMVVLTLLSDVDAVSNNARL